MATLLGTDYMLWIESAVADAYTLLGGQKEMSFDRSSSSLGTSSKATWPHTTSRQGAITIKLGLDGQVDLPDTAFSRLETKYKALEPVKVQIRGNGTAGVDADAVFECEMALIGFPRDYPGDGIVVYKLGMEPFGAPTIDALD